MSRARLLAALAVLLAPALTGACGDGDDPSPAEGAPGLEVRFRVDGLGEPRGVAWDSVRGRWLITVSGGAGSGGGTGRVVAVHPGGDTVERRAFGGSAGGVTLDTPRGIDVRGERAYVAAGRRVVALDLADREVAFDLRIPGSGRLHDVAVDGRGIIYVSDPSADAVFRVAPDGSGWNRMGTAGSLRGPSGLLFERTDDGEGRLLAAGHEGAVMALDPDSSVTLLAEAPGLGDLDGLQRSPDGGLLVTEPSGGRLLFLQSGPGTVWRSGIAWLDGLDRPVDFLLRRGVLALPEAGAGRVTFYRVTD